MHLITFKLNNVNGATRKSMIFWTQYISLFTLDYLSFIFHRYTDIGLEYGSDHVLNLHVDTIFFEYFENLSVKFNWVSSESKPNRYLAI